MHADRVKNKYVRANVVSQWALKFRKIFRLEDKNRMSPEDLPAPWKSGGVLNTHVALTITSAYGISTLTLTLVYTVAMVPTTPQPMNHPRYFPVNAFISACALREQRDCYRSFSLSFFFLSSPPRLYGTRGHRAAAAAAAAAGSYRSLRPLNIRRRCSLSSSTEITRASNIQYDIG